MEALHCFYYSSIFWSCKPLITRRWESTAGGKDHFYLLPHFLLLITVTDRIMGYMEHVFGPEWQFCDAWFYEVMNSRVNVPVCFSAINEHWVFCCSFFYLFIVVFVCLFDFNMLFQLQ